MPYIPAAAFAGGAPKAPNTQVIQINQFNGIDLSSKPTLMSLTRSPDCQNMMRSAPGKVKRRMGYERVNEMPFPGRINGATIIRNDRNEIRVVHAGTKIYYDGVVVAGSRAEAIESVVSGNPVEDTGVADNRSCIVRMPEEARTVLFDGKAVRGFAYADNADTGDRIYFCPKLSDNAYVPTVMIDRDPKGGGTAYEEINLLSDAFTELFFSDGESTAYQMSFDELMPEKGTVVKLMESDGVTWETLTEGVDYTVNYATGVINFAAAPAVTPADGQSNVSITVSKDRSEKRAWIDKCTIATSYELPTGGSRIFATGNPDYPNRDYWSDIGDLTYWPDLNYSMLGDARERIIGYSRIGSYLATHKADGTIYVRAATTDENDAYRQMFPVMSIVRGPRNLAPRSFAAMDNEPLFLTENGIYALTSADLTAEKYAQNRSFYLNGRLTAEAGLEDASAIVWDGNYILTVNGRAYVLDGSTKSYNQNEPHSAYQYECFLWNNIPARVLWAWDNKLHFGDSDGNIYRFDKALLTDDGQPFSCCWETPDLQGGLFHKQRRYTKAALQIQPGEDVDIELSVNGGTGWRLSTLMSFPPSENARRMIRRLDMDKMNYASLRISCNRGQSFEPDAINIEYIQSGADDNRL